VFKRASLWLIPILAFTLLGAQACSRKLNPQDSCNFVQNPELQRISWKSEGPVPLYVHESLPPEDYPSLQRAIAQYNHAFGREVFRVIAWGVNSPSAPGRDGYSTIFKMHTWDPNKQMEQARTTIYWAGAQIYEADIRLNAADFQFYPGTATTFSEVDLESIFVHELGHVLGLAHNVTSGSVMNFSLNDGQVRRDLGSMDIQSLHCEY
jgi:hypothetical protein